MATPILATNLLPGVTGRQVGRDIKPPENPLVTPEDKGPQTFPPPPPPRPTIRRKDALGRARGKNAGRILSRVVSRQNS